MKPPPPTQSNISTIEANQERLGDVYYRERSQPKLDLSLPTAETRMWHYNGRFSLYFP
jgi:hypothetical protein